jgi:hypothetical protein
MALAMVPAAAMLRVSGAWDGQQRDCAEHCRTERRGSTDFSDSFIKAHVSSPFSRPSDPFGQPL